MIAESKTNDCHEEFWKHVIKTNYCWLWNGPQNITGYGLFRFQGKMELVHRFSARIHGWGKSIINKEVDHRCRTRNCVNPGHFRYVTHKQNMQLINNPNMEISESFIKFSDLSREEQLYVSLSEQMGCFNGIDDIKKMFAINRFYDKKLIVDCKTAMENCKYESYDYFVSGYFKYKYFAYLYETIKEYNFTLLEAEILVDQLPTDRIKKYMDGILE